MLILKRHYWESLFVFLLFPFVTSFHFLFVTFHDKLVVIHHWLLFILSVKEIDLFCGLHWCELSWSKSLFFSWALVWLKFDERAFLFSWVLVAWRRWGFPWLASLPVYFGENWFYVVWHGCFLFDDSWLGFVFFVSYFTRFTVLLMIYIVINLVFKLFPLFIFQLHFLSNRGIQVLIWLSDLTELFVTCIWIIITLVILLDAKQRGLLIRLILFCLLLGLIIDSLYSTLPVILSAYHAWVSTEYCNMQNLKHYQSDDPFSFWL